MLKNGTNKNKKKKLLQEIFEMKVYLNGHIIESN